MRKLVALLAFAAAIGAGTPAFAEGSYDFCVKRIAGAKTEVLHTRVNFTELDPGREVARFVTTQKFRRLTDNSVTTTDYARGACRGEIREFSLTLSAEDIRRVAIALGNGDIDGAAKDAAAIITSTITSIMDPEMLEGAQKLLCGLVEC